MTDTGVTSRFFLKTLVKFYIVCFVQILSSYVTSIQRDLFNNSCSYDAT
jgi:hypothetical protein